MIIATETILQIWAMLLNGTSGITRERLSVKFTDGNEGHDTINAVVGIHNEISE